MSARRRKRGGDDGEHHIDERWMASYMDMVTVLMCMFLVLFAMSTTDAKKFQLLRDSLATGFGVTKTDTVDTAQGVIVKPHDVGKKGTLTKIAADIPGVTQKDIDAAQSELNKLDELRDQIDQHLAAQNLQGSVKYTVDERGLTVRLTGSETFFRPNSADLTDRAAGVLNVISSVVAPIPQQISVEGNANPGGSSYPYPTDWELSSARAVSVVRYFVEQRGIAAGRMGAAGFSDARPIDTSGTPEGQALNRRVDIVILSDQPEKIRAIIPELLKIDGTPEVQSPSALTPEQFAQLLSSRAAAAAADEKHSTGSSGEKTSGAGKTSSSSDHSSGGH